MRGILGAFRELDATVEALRELKQKRLGEITVFTPAPRHELDDVLAAGPSPVRRVTLITGLLGATFGYWIAIWASDYWPLVVGGKPVASWVPYTIIGFEMMVLVGALSTVYAMFYYARLPKLGGDGRIRSALQPRRLRRLGRVRARAVRGSRATAPPARRGGGAW